ncbi:MAG: class I SAM-dependent methyltransferase [Acidobacteriota bacterium]|nr:class I SAM-dependent methyltransferase [Acidobacteriota bacterium]
MKIKKINLVRLLALEFAFLLLVGCASVATLQVKQAEQNRNANAAATPSDEINRPRSEPYTGSLSIFEDPKREENLQIARVMDILKIKDSAAVADIGAGSGWFTTRAARRTKGTVYAVEINPEYVNHINERAKKENLPNIKTILGKEDDPLLPEKSIDAVLILKTYHEIGAPIRLMKNLKKSLRKGALVGIIDRSGKGDDHGIDSQQVIKEMEQAGFVLSENHDFVKSEGIEYFLVFRAK